MSGKRLGVGAFWSHRVLALLRPAIHCRGMVLAASWLVVAGLSGCGWMAYGRQAPISMEIEMIGDAHGDLLRTGRKGVITLSVRNDEQAPIQLWTLWGKGYMGLYPFSAECVPRGGLVAPARIPREVVVGRPWTCEMANLLCVFSDGKGTEHTVRLGPPDHMAVLLPGWELALQRLFDVPERPGTYRVSVTLEAYVATIPPCYPGYPWLLRGEHPRPVRLTCSVRGVRVCAADSPESTGIPERPAAIDYMPGSGRASP